MTDYFWTKRTPKPYGGLPRELRDMIWKELLIFGPSILKKPIRAGYRESEKIVAADSQSSRHVLDWTHPSQCSPLATNAVTFIYKHPLCPSDEMRVIPHLQLFLVNRQTYKEALAIFYAQNHFLTQVDNTADAQELPPHARADVRSLVLLTKWPDYKLYANLHITFNDFENLQEVLILLPAQPPFPPEPCKDIITPLQVVVGLVKTLLQGRFKSLHFLLADCSACATGQKANNLACIKLLRRLSSGAVISRKAWSRAKKAWIKSDMVEYASAHSLLDLEIAEEEQQTFLVKSRCEKGPGQPHRVQLTLSRPEDRTVQKETVDRPKPVMIKPGPFEQFVKRPYHKRALPAYLLENDPTPPKISRLRLPQFLAFSESRRRRLDPDEDQRRRQGKLDQLHRCINRTSRMR